MRRKPDFILPMPGERETLEIYGWPLPKEKPMAITFGDRLIDSGYHDITPEQEREIEAREECARRGLDPDDDAADGIVVWMVVDKEMRERRSVTLCSECGVRTGELLYFSPFSQRYVHQGCRTPADESYEIPTVFRAALSRS
jgi:hypothetical protein